MPKHVGNVTVIREHMGFARRRGLRQRTLTNRADVLNALAIWLDTTRNLSLLEATEQDLDAWESAITTEPSPRTGRPVALHTLATYSSHVRCFYGWARRVRLVEQDPTADMPRTRVLPGTPRPIPERDLTIAVKWAPEPVRTWLLLAAVLGLRAGEVARIRREDVRDAEDYPVLIIDGKGGRERVAPLPVELLPVLAPWLGCQAGPLFRQPSGAAFTPRHVTAMVSAHLRQLDLPYTMHSFRHRAATQGYRRSKDILATRNLLGHASVATTMQYAKEADGAVRGIADALAEDVAALLGESARALP